MDSNHIVYLSSMLPGKLINDVTVNLKLYKQTLIHDPVIFRFRYLVSCLRTVQIHFIGSV